MKAKTRLAAPAVCALLAVSLLVGGCGGGSNTGSGGTLRVGIASTTVDSLNPFVGQSSLSLLVYRVVYPYLMQYNNVGHPVMDWATHYKISPNRRVWTFTTRTGARWSDGQPLTAADAAWTINTAVKFENGAAANLSEYVTNVTGAVATSPTTLEVKFSRPTSFLYGAASLPILPRHIWERDAQGAGARLKTYPNVKPVGGGPFVLTRYTQNQFVGFTRNKHYYGPTPKLTGFGIEEFSNNDALVGAIETNAIDVALDIPSTTLKTLRRQPDIHIVSKPAYDVILFGINSNPNKKTDPELRNPTVRKAIALAINRKQIMSTLTSGTGAVTSSVLPADSPYSDDRSLPAPASNPDEANHLLDSLGYKRGANGIRVANGHAMNYRLLFGNTTTGAPLDVSLIVQSLKAIGIRATPIESDPTAYTAAINRGHYTQFEFSVDDYGPDFDPNHYLALPTCYQFGAENETGYCTSQYDALYRLQAAQTGSARQTTIDKMQRLLFQSKPLIPIYQASNIAAVRSKVHGFSESPIDIVNYESNRWFDDITVR